MKPEAIIFDLDGTLTYTLQDIADAMNYALRLHGLTEHPLDAYRMMVGNGAHKLAERATAGHPELTEAVLSDYQHQYETHSQVTTRPYDGMPETLHALEAMGIPLCVLSNKPDADTVNVVHWYFPEIGWHIVRGQRPGVPVKPDPTAAHAILAELGTDPAKCFYVGDSSVDMETAHAAGMVAIGAAWGFRDRAELEAYNARFIIDDPRELIALAQG